MQSCLNIACSQSMAQMLIHVPTMIEMAHNHNLEFVHMTNFKEFYSEHKLLYGRNLSPSVVLALQKFPTALLDFVSMYTTFVFRKQVR